MANQKAYEDLKAAKEAEIAAGQEQIDTKTQELADTDEKVSSFSQDSMAMVSVACPPFPLPTDIVSPSPRRQYYHAQTPPPTVTEVTVVD